MLVLPVDSQLLIRSKGRGGIPKAEKGRPVPAIKYRV
jgi:hypothetical protein